MSLPKSIFTFSIVLILVFGISGCKNDNLENEEFQVEVIGKGFDCVEIFLIKFLEEDEKRINKFLEHTNAYFPVFYANNLVEQHKEAGLILNVILDKCGVNDFRVCTAMGPGYSHVCIKLSETISLTFP